MTEEQKERKNAYQRAYYRRNKAALSVKAKKRARGNWLLKKYGLREADYADLYAAQGGQCFICGPNITSPKRWQGSLAVDHDHTTGKVRSLLCDRCNKMIGMVNEDPYILRAAAQYLFAHQPMEVA